MSEFNISRRIHIDAIGGVAGDMFVGAMLDDYPEAITESLTTIRRAGIPESVKLEVNSHTDHSFRGTRFEVATPDDKSLYKKTSFRTICDQLNNSKLQNNIIVRAIEILKCLAVAEGIVHDVCHEDVTFHEIGGWDSIADIVGAAYLIEYVGNVRWSLSSIPMGSGLIQCEHGTLPVPVPAVVELLKGFNFHNDGRLGERITPTGAAIIAHLKPDIGPQKSQMLGVNGIGFGKNEFEGISNILRILEFKDHSPIPDKDYIAVLHFEIDDQNPEDLAIGLDNLRVSEGVLDVIQIPALGKKGRLTTQIQILAKPNVLDELIAQCFNQTTTLGLRWELSNRTLLKRTHIDSNQGIGVKVVQRPSGAITAKAEISQIGTSDSNHSSRTIHKRTLEDSAIKSKEEND